ncbi:MAG: cell division protein FtsA [Bacteroidales bacterium]|jgi:cell division protein FtsA|nr:cell division protein FtsA [Bacteroidales bacterium]
MKMQIDKEMKLPSNVFVVGLDIGTTKIAAIVGKLNENHKLDVLGYGTAESLGVRRGVVSNIENTVESIKIAIEQAKISSGVNIQNVHVGIAGQHIRSEQQSSRLIRKNAEEDITDDDVQQLTENMFDLCMTPGEEIIDVIPQEFTIDGEPGIKEPVGMLGSSLEANFHIIVGQTAAARNIYKCVTRAGLNVVDLILEPIASAEAVLSEEEKEAGVALVDIGGGTTDIALFYDGVIRHTAVIPLGGDIITEDIKEGCNIIKKFAEELKIKFGSALAQENSDMQIIAIPGLKGRPPKEISMKNLARIIEARTTDIIEKVYSEIKFSGYERKLSAGIVLTGGGSLLKDILQLTQYITGKDVRVGYPNEHLSNNQTIKDIASPIYSTCIGLVLNGLSKIEEEKQKRKKQEFNEVTDKVIEKEIEKIVEEKPKKERKPRLPFLKKIQKFLEEDEE